MQIRNKASDTDQAVNNYCLALQERYSFLPPGPTERIVMCEWQVKYQNEAQKALALGTTALGVTIRRFQKVHFTTYHNMLPNEADVYLKGVLSFRNGNTPAIAIGGVLGFVVMASIVYLIILICTSPSPMPFTVEIQVGIFGALILLCSVAMYFVILFLYKINNRIYPPNTHIFLKDDDITLSRLAIYDSNQIELAMIKMPGK